MSIPGAHPCPQTGASVTPASHPPLLPAIRLRRGLAGPTMDKLAGKRALRAIQHDLAPHRLGLEDGHFTLLEHEHEPCHGLACGCSCRPCRHAREVIAEHRAAGRHPFNPDGTIKPRPCKRQPWELAA